MQRVHADDVDTPIGRTLHQLAQVREVADAPIARRADEIELGRDAPEAGLTFCPFWKPAS